LKLNKQVAMVLFLAAIFLAAGVPLVAQDERPTRSVKGLVTDEHENPIEGAVVQLKNTKTLQVKSFITDKDGSYYFHGLDTNVDFQLNARSGDAISRTRTVSTFDDRKEVVYNFELKVDK
jgi:Carboxypeptidase regulatory-like domain